MNVKAGDTIKAGQIIGKTGATGNASTLVNAKGVLIASEMHLHFELSTADNFVRGIADRINPMSHFNARMEVH